MAFFWKKQENIDKMLGHYFDQCDKCLKLFEKALLTYMDSGQGEAFEAAVNKTHEAESSADDLRREIVFTLYGKALLPESRGDLLQVLEAFDKLPGMAETILFVIRCQQIVFPDELIPLYKQLVKINLQAYYLTRKAVDALLNNPRVTLHATKEVDDKESESDRLEREIMCDIFSSDMDMGTKMMFKELVLLIGNIADRAENTADLIAIVAIKRQI